MTPEEFDKIKQAEKAHLKEIRALKNQLRSLKKRNEIASTIRNMEEASGKDLLDTHDEMLNKLHQEIAEQEARFEIALESAKESSSDEEIRLEVENEEALQRARARDLIKQIKLQMGLPQEEIDTPPQKQDAPSNVATETSKTIGRVRTEKSDELDSDTPAGSKEESPLPDKTIGRLKK